MERPLDEEKINFGRPQNSWEGKDRWRPSSATSLAESRASCSRLCLAGFWMSPRMDTPGLLF